MVGVAHKVEALTIRPADVVGDGHLIQVGIGGQAAVVQRAICLQVGFLIKGKEVTFAHAKRGLVGVRYVGTALVVLMPVAFAVTLEVDPMVVRLRIAVVVPVVVVVAVVGGGAVVRVVSEAVGRRPSVVHTGEVAVVRRIIVESPVRHTCGVSIAEAVGSGIAVVVDA